MNIITFFLGLLLGGVIVWKIKHAETQSDQKKKQTNKRRILALFKTHKKITNNQVEALLAKSDATAERYLDELEHEGKITQIGRTGRSVSYQQSKK